MISSQSQRIGFEFATCGDLTGVEAMPLYTAAMGARGSVSRIQSSCAIMEFGSV